MSFTSYLIRLPSKFRRKARRSRLIAMFVLLMVFGLFCTPFYFFYKPPNFLIRAFQRRWPTVLWRVSTTSKVIALTIDDGPSEYTNDIIQILRANDATATFFIIGSQVRGREEMLEDLIRNGNELGNHAMHDEPSRGLSDAILVEQINAVEAMVLKAYSATHVTSPPKYFRPGSGFFSERMLKVLETLDYRLVLGSIYPHDPQIPFWRLNARHVLSSLRPGGIIICHDRRGWTAPMLRNVLPEMKRRGYRVVSVSQLLRDAGT